MSPEELATERLLLKERWSLIQSGVEKKDIKINKDSLYIKHQLHATVKDSQLVLLRETSPPSHLLTQSDYDDSLHLTLSVMTSLVHGDMGFK